MVKSLLIAVNEKLTCDDTGKLLLRLAVGGLMLFHGLHKAIDGVGGSQACWWRRGCQVLSLMAYWLAK